MDFCEILKLLRTKRKLTQAELGDSIGVSKRTIQRWESRQASPKLYKIMKLCRFFHISYDQLLGLAPLNDNALSENEFTLLELLKGLSEEDLVKVEEHIQQVLEHGE